MELIRKRAASGLDPDGGAYAAYTPEYAKRKGSSRPNLTLTGELLRSLQVISVEDGRATIGFTGTHPRSELVKGNRKKGGSYHVVLKGGGTPNAIIAAGLAQKREILGIRSAEDRAKLAAIFEAEMKRLLAALK